MGKGRTIRAAILVGALGWLAACDGGTTLVSEDPEAADDGSGGGDTDTDDGTGITGDRAIPPGTRSPSPDDSLFRLEPQEGGDDGDGFVTGVSYDRRSDTFTVTGLPFDGEPTDGWARSRPRNINGYALYEAPLEVPDSVTAAPVTQLQHRALYGVSRSRDTSFAIVRTGSYADYGFGGFVYQRDGGVVIPDEGQAIYEGDYAGLRDFDGRGGLEYTEGRMELRLDFGGFDTSCTGAGCETAVYGEVRDRRIFDASGNDITSDVLDGIEVSTGNDLADLPVLFFTVSNQAADANGELLGELRSTVGGEDFETGNYYALMAGDHAADTGEVVGVIVVTSTDPRGSNATVRETGGFIATRVSP